MHGKWPWLVVGFVVGTGLGYALTHTYEGSHDICEKKKSSDTPYNWDDEAEGDQENESPICSGWVTICLN